MATTNLKRHSSGALAQSSRENQIDSNQVSTHWQFPFLAGALLDFAICFPVSTEMMVTQSLSHPFGTCCDQIIAGTHFE